MRIALVGAPAAPGPVLRDASCEGLGVVGIVPLRRRAQTPCRVGRVQAELEHRGLILLCGRRGEAEVPGHVQQLQTRVVGGALHPGQAKRDRQRQRRRIAADTRERVGRPANALRVRSIVAEVRRALDGATCGDVIPPAPSRGIHRESEVEGQRSIGGSGVFHRHPSIDAVVHGLQDGLHGETVLEAPVLPDRATFRGDLALERPRLGTGLVIAEHQPGERRHLLRDGPKRSAPHRQARHASRVVQLQARAALSLNGVQRLAHLVGRSSDELGVELCLPLLGRYQLHAVHPPCVVITPRWLRLVQVDDDAAHPVAIVGHQTVGELDPPPDGHHVPHELLQGRVPIVDHDAHELLLDRRVGGAHLHPVAQGAIAAPVVFGRVQRPRPLGIALLPAPGRLHREPQTPGALLVVIAIHGHLARPLVLQLGLGGRVQGRVFHAVKEPRGLLGEGGPAEGGKHQTEQGASGGHEVDLSRCLPGRMVRHFLSAQTHLGAR